MGTDSGSDGDPPVLAPVLAPAPRSFAAVIRREFRTRELDCHPFAQRGELAPPPQPPAPPPRYAVEQDDEATVIVTESATAADPRRRLAHTVVRARRAPRNQTSAPAEQVVELSVDDSDHD